MSENKIEISKEGFKDVLGMVIKNMDAQNKMIEGWEHDWKKDAVKRADDLMDALDNISGALIPLANVGITLSLVEHQIRKAYVVADKILIDANMRLEAFEKVHNKKEEDIIKVSENDMKEGGEEDGEKEN